MKGTRGGPACPVAGTLVLLLLASCGGDPASVPAAGETPDPRPGPATAELVPLDGFSLTEAPPETLEVLRTGGGPAEVLSVEASPGVDVAMGDTLLTLEDILLRVELQRVEMEIQLAAALTAADTTEALRARLESLGTARDSLQGIAVLPVLAPAAGRLLSIHAAPGDGSAPGALLARLSVGPESLYVATPPAGARMTSWPEETGALRLVEQTPPGALYYGTPGSGGPDFGCMFLVVRNALYEDGLRTFLVTGAGDTLEAGMAGTAEGGIIVRVPDGEAGMEVRTWGS